MSRLLAAFTHHHDSEKRPWRAFVSCEADAVEQALQGEWGLVPREDTAAVLARAKDAGEDGTTARTCCQGDEDTGEDGDSDPVVVWFYHGDDGPNFGCGRGSSLEDTDKRDNVWIHLEEWVPDAKRKAELESLSKDELVQRLLEVEACR